MNEQLAPASARRRMIVLCAVAMTLLVGACAAVGTPATPPATVTSVSSPAASTAAPQTTPSAESTASLSPTPAPASATPSDDGVDPPPIAQLELGDGSVVPGYLGGWCYDGTCLDGPPPPKAELPLVQSAGAAGLAFALADTHPFSYASASYAAGHEAGQTELTEVGEYFDPYISPATSAASLSTFNFAAPPNGDWVLRVSLQFGDRGDAVYFWHVASD